MIMALFQVDLQTALDYALLPYLAGGGFSLVETTLAARED